MQSSRSRKPTDLPQSIHGRLNLYALAATAAGVGLLAAAQAAEAKIVYTRAHQKLPLNHYFFLDLNHDGINDFKFQAFTSDVNRRGTFGTRDSAFLFLYPQVKGNQVVGKQPHASALRAGVRIGPKRSFNNSSRPIMGGVDVFSGAGPTYTGPWADSGKPVDDRFLGLQFVIKGKVHFGWARFNVLIHRNPEATISAVLTGYAYETIPGKPIIAGATKDADDVEPTASPSPTSQPATLGMLALGGPGLAIWRRDESLVAVPRSN